MCISRNIAKALAWPNSASAQACPRCPWTGQQLQRETARVVPHVTPQNQRESKKQQMHSCCPSLFGPCMDGMWNLLSSRARMNGFGFQSAPIQAQLWCTRIIFSGIHSLSISQCGTLAASIEWHDGAIAFVFRLHSLFLGLGFCFASLPPQIKAGSARPSCRMCS